MSLFHRQKVIRKKWMLYTRLLLLLMLIIPQLSLANQTVYFEPRTVELTGTIVTLKFPGPPNYESIKNGDRDETGPYLILNNPIDIKLSSNVQTGNDEPTKNVKLIQLIVLNDSDWDKVKEGNQAHITGTLSSALTGHHHARILLDINKISVVSQRAIINKLDVTTNDLEFLENQNLQN